LFWHVIFSLTDIYLCCNSGSSDTRHSKSSYADVFQECQIRISWRSKTLRAILHKSFLFISSMSTSQIESSRLTPQEGIYSIDLRVVESKSDWKIIHKMLKQCIFLVACICSVKITGRRNMIWIRTRITST
jgi:hypothetical protein